MANKLTIIIAAVCTIAGTAHAQSDLPYLLQADRLLWSQPGERLTAIGHVRLAHEGGWMYADRVTLYADDNTLDAAGSVSWQTNDSSGRAAQVYMDLTANTGWFRGATVETGDGTRIWGRTIRRTGPQSYAVADGGFTPCDCPDQRGAPAWRITVREAELTWRESVRFKHGTFWGDRIPVFYLPVGYIPLLDARQTGLLMPRFSYSNRYGFMVKPGLFATLGDHADVTLWSDYHTLGGWGIETETRAKSPTGSYEVRFDWFKESDDAPFLAKEGRGPAKRWTVDVELEEQPRDWFRLAADMRILSDEQLDTDFADNLDDLTRASSDSEAHISNEWAGIGSGILRLSASQSLLNAQSTGSRAPSLWLRSDPQVLGEWPLWLSADLRYDHFSTYNEARGSPWHPNAYDREGRRVILGARAGGRIDPLPGLQISGHLGTWTGWRDRTFYTVVGEVPYRTSSRTVGVTATTVAYADAAVEYGLVLHNRWATAHVRPGLDTTWSRPTRTPGLGIEDIDTPRWQTWLIPRLYIDGRVGHAGSWQYELRYPVAYQGRPLPQGLWTHDLQVGRRFIDIYARIWQRDTGQRLPRLDTEFRIKPHPDHTLTLGFGRSTTDFTTQTWDLGRGEGYADDPLAIRPYREALLQYSWAIWRFSGDLTARRRFPQYPGHPAAWVERSAAISYHDPCECLHLTLAYRDLPGNTADRVDLQIDFALLGGVGTRDVQ